MAPIEPETPSEPPTQEPAAASTAAVDEMDDGEFDLSGWEAEDEPTRPEADLVVVDSASAVQIAITAHEPVDSSTEWDDIDAYLPEVALPLARADDVEGRRRLRLLLLRAIREGSVPAQDVQAQSTNEDRSANEEAEAYLALVINDLGAEVDERFEYSNADESFEVFVDPEEMPDEEAALDEALVAIDRAASPRHEPLRIYQREFQRLRRLTAEEEVQLAKDMEAALDVALDALATWPFRSAVGALLACQCPCGEFFVAFCLGRRDRSSPPVSRQERALRGPPLSPLHDLAARRRAVGGADASLACRDGVLDRTPIHRLLFLQ